MLGTEEPPREYDVVSDTQRLALLVENESRVHFSVVAYVIVVVDLPERPLPEPLGQLP